MRLFPSPRFSALGNVYDHQQYLGLQPARPGIQVVTVLDSSISGSGQPRRKLPVECGPPAGRKIQPEFQERLRAIGDWLRTNGDSIYGTTYGPVQGMTAARTTAKENKIFVHVFDWPGTHLDISGLNPKVLAAHLHAYRTTIEIPSDRRKIADRPSRSGS